MVNEKLEKDFKEYNLQIDKLAEQEVQSIRKDVEALKIEAARIGEAVELSFKVGGAQGKKVNSSR